MMFSRYRPLSGEEVLRASPKGTKLYLYQDLALDPRPAEDIVLSLGRNVIVLYQDPDNLQKGHWVSLKIKPEKREIYFFSSYGGMPDREKNTWVPHRKLVRTFQDRNVLNDGLKQLMIRGWTIHYNDFPFQRVGDKTATCGLWSSAFLKSDVNPDVFARNHHSEKYYFDHLF